MRSSRWYPYFLIATLAVCTALAVATRADSAVLAPHDATPTKISNTIIATWNCQDWIGVRRTHPSHSPWALPRSSAYRAWVLNRWQQRRDACRAQLQARKKVERKLQQALAGTPMAGTARELERAGHRWHIHPAFIAAIAGTESTYGRAACASNRYNAFGLASCGSSWSVPTFASWAQAYEFMGSFLSSRWTRARTPWDFHGYAACSSCWGNSTAGHMRELGFAPYVRY